MAKKAFPILTALATLLITGPAKAYPHDPFTVVLVDKGTNQLHVGKYQEERINILKSYHATLGKALGDKEIENDLKTPEGVYFFTARLLPPSIKKKLGVMALQMDYPNPIDRLAGKTGYAIMLHATDDPSRLQKKYDSEGCVVIDNPQIQEISGEVRLGLTPIIVYSEMKPEYLQVESFPEVKKTFERWLNAWAAKDLDAYIGTYTDGFKYSGMNIKQYRTHKKSLNERYAQITVNAKNVRYFFHPKYNVVTFTQEYESRLKNGAPGFKSSGTKQVYFVKSGDAYRIASENYSSVVER